MGRTTWMEDGSTLSRKVGGAGIHMFCVYGYDTGRQGHERLNAELDENVVGAIAALDGAAWVAGGDWNRTPEMVREAGFLEP
eukprot:15962410-Heterocapsa_arctica.AAC.1